MDNSKDGKDQKDKYLETIKNMLLEEMHLFNMKALIFLDQCHFF